MARLCCSVLLAAALGCGLATGGDRRDPGDVLEAPCSDDACDPLAPSGAGGGAAQPAGTEGERAAACRADGVFWASLDLRDQAGLNSIQGCERVAGNLGLTAFAGMDVSPLARLRVVDGTVRVEGAAAPAEDALEALSALEQAGDVLLQNLSTSSLAPLARLRRIAPRTSQDELLDPAGFSSDATGTGGFRINRCNQLQSLSGLDSLEELAWLEILDGAELTSFYGAPRLRQVPRLYVSSSPLSSLQGLESLQVQELVIFSSQLTQLSLGDATSLVKLTLADNRQLVSLQGNRLPARMEEVKLLNVDALRDLRGLEGLREVTRLSLISEAEQSALTSLTGLDGLQRVGTLDLSGLPLLGNFVGLEALLEVQDRLSVRASPGLSSLEGLSGLVQAQSINIQGSQALSSVAGFASPSIASLSLSPLSATSLAGLEGVTVTESLELLSAAQLRSLDGLPQLAPSASFFLYDAPVLADLDALTAVSSLLGLALSGTGAPHLDVLVNLRQLETLTLSDNERLTQIDGLSQISGLKLLTVTRNAALRTLPTWVNVRPEPCANCERFSLRVTGNPALESGPGLPGVQEASGVSFEANSALSSLLGLSELRTVESLEVVGNAALTLISLPNLTRATWVRIHNNPLLDEAPLAPLRDLPEANIKIVSNQSGPAELAVCPWIGDGECDELAGNCAAGSDRTDCGWGQ